MKYHQFICNCIMHDLLDVKMIISIQDCNFHFYELDDYLKEQLKIFAL